MKLSGEKLLMLLALALVVLRRSLRWDNAWAWPVPVAVIGGIRYRPVISQESKAGHNGVDIMYRRGDTPASDLRTKYRPGTHDGSAGYFAPEATPVLAARAGKVYSVAKADNGWQVRLDHGRTSMGPVTTLYLHLQAAAVMKGQHVEAGQPIGFMGYDPSPADGGHLRHLHFEVWQGEAGEHRPVSPDDVMRSWPVASEFEPKV